MAGIISKYGFTDRQIEQDDPVTAYVEVHDTSKHPGMTYGVVWAVDGDERGFWGGAFVGYPIPMIGFAIQRLFAMFPERHLHVHGHGDFWNHIAPKWGHVRHAMKPDTWGRNKRGDSYAGFEPISEAARLYDKRRLSYQSMPKLAEGHHLYVPRKAALDLASGPAREALDAYYYQDNGPRGPSSCRIVVEG